MENKFTDLRRVAVKFTLTLGLALGLGAAVVGPSYAQTVTPGTNTVVTTQPQQTQNNDNGFPWGLLGLLGLAGLLGARPQQPRVIERDERTTSVRSNNP